LQVTVWAIAAIDELRERRLALPPPMDVDGEIGLGRHPGEGRRVEPRTERPRKLDGSVTVARYGR